MQIAIPIFEGITALDAVGPYEVLQRLPNLEIVFIGHEQGTVRSDSGSLGITADATFEDVPAPDVIVFPGGPGTRTLMHDQNVLDWVRAAHQTTTFTTSVCTGALILGAAGLLDGLEATTHWGAYELLESTGAIPVTRRVVEHLDHRIITAAGVSSGIDMALRLAELLIGDLAARAMQLAIEYDPQPPFDSGSVAKAAPEVLALIASYRR
jgi:putative intracellular protease/amidase